ncbi:MAG TPA: hypothetical protein VFO64_03960 [Gaiellaceae bacterium]|jgi:hypothetical protein|nr:hypothetical protein [Gaiellaceae bacterium]
MDTNGGDLGSRITQLNQRVDILSESLRQVIHIVRETSSELAWAIGNLNALEIQERRQHGEHPVPHLLIDRQLAALDEVIDKLGKS